MICHIVFAALFGSALCSSGVIFPGGSSSSDAGAQHSPSVGFSTPSISPGSLSPSADHPQERFFNIPNLFDACTYKCEFGSKREFNEHCCRKGFRECCYGGYGHSFVPQPSIFGGLGGQHAGFGSNGLGYGGFGGNHGGYPYPGNSHFIKPPIVGPPISPIAVGSGFGSGHYGGVLGYGGGFGAPQCPKLGPFSGLFGLRSNADTRASVDQVTGPSAYPTNTKKLRFQRDVDTHSDNVGPVNHNEANTRFIHIPNIFCNHSCNNDYDCYHVSPYSKCCVDYYNCRKCINPHLYH